MSKKDRIKFTPNITSTCIDVTPIDYDIAATLEIDPVKYFVDSSSARKAKVLKRYNLDEYCQMMQEHGETRWEIGWESLPKYINHKIFNRNTMEVATVTWTTDMGPCLINDAGERIPCCACDFRHGNAYWMYFIGEDYSTPAAICDDSGPSEFKTGNVPWQYYVRSKIKENGLCSSI